MSKDKELKAALADIEKRWGKGAIQKMDGSGAHRVPHFPTGLLGLDRAIGVGGLPKGRVVEIYGPESSGKTTLTLQSIASVQRQGGVCAFIDAEHALDPSYAKALGVQLDDLLVSQPDCGEQALAITEALARSGAVDLIVVDSVAALTPRAELEGQMGDSHMGLQARLMSQALRKLTGAVNKAGTIVMFINQLRQKIGVTFGSNETTPGGNALKFYCSLRFDVRRIGSIKEGDQHIGNRTRIRVVKNKLAPPFQQVEMEMHFGHGLCWAADLLDRALEEGVVEKRGAFFRFNGEVLGHGRNACRTALRENEALATELRRQVWRALFPPQGEGEGEATPGEAVSHGKAAVTDGAGKTETAVAKTGPTRPLPPKADSRKPPGRNTAQA